MSRAVHLVGIGGAGLSAIAHVLHDRGEKVTGSDQALSLYAQALQQAGVTVYVGHAEEQVMGADLVIASSAIQEGNVELDAAHKAGIPVLRRQAFLEDITSGFQTLAVAGTHGKTTTSGLIAWILQSAGLDPSFIVGGLLPDFAANGKAGNGPHFVVEADEYDRAFLGLSPKIAVVTSIEHDHPDCYPTYEAVLDAFQEFTEQVETLLVTCSDDPGAQALNKERIMHTTYGIREQADWRAEEIRANAAGGMDFLVVHNEETLGLVRTRLPGEHNVLNTLAGLAVAGALEIPFERTREALTTYHGPGQRFEILGQVDGVVVVDDYAHHPTEIRATLATARLRFQGSTIWAVFQPHTYSRIRALMAAYISAFSDADHVIVTEVFGAREEPDQEMTGRTIAEKIDHHDVQFLDDFKEIAEQLANNVKPGDVVVTLSAGDANVVGRFLMDELSK
jgi:UDP-N-acetylmuramate--alanine ligase